MSYPREKSIHSAGIPWPMAGHLEPSVGEKELSAGKSEPLAGSKFRKSLQVNWLETKLQQMI
jgi:hypothetical protein